MANIKRKKKAAPPPAPRKARYLVLGAVGCVILAIVSVSLIDVTMGFWVLLPSLLTSAACGLMVYAEVVTSAARGRRMGVFGWILGALCVFYLADTVLLLRALLQNG